MRHVGEIRTDVLDAMIHVGEGSLALQRTAR